MILRQVILDNFGLFRERVTIDLTPRARNGLARPVVLIGGKNGAGKTTLLEAIRLALYGKKALGSRVAQDEYEEYLRGRIHRPLDGSAAPTGASVGLVFDYADEGRVRTYDVRREWRARGRTVVESLLVHQDGSVVVDVPRDEWHFFLEDLIPSGVSQLFFFDGEKIQEMAAGEHDEGQLADAIRGLLGIELVSRLRTDLGLYLARQSRSDSDQLAADLERVTRDIDVLDEQLIELHESVAHLATRKESEARAAEHARHRFVAEGGEIATQRAMMEAELASVSARIVKFQQELRDLANGPLAFAVAPKLTRALRAALLDVQEGLDSKTRHVLASQLRRELKLWHGKAPPSDAPKRKASWRTEHWNDLQDFLRYWGAKSPDETGKAIGLTISEREKLLERLNYAEQTTRPRLETIANSLDRAVQRHRQLQGRLVKADATSSNALLDELQIAEQRLGAISATLTMREEELSKLRGQRVTLEREQRRVLDQQSRSAQDERSTQLAARAISALGTYEQQLLQSKLAIVRREFLRCFSHLARKEGLLHDVRIDPNTFVVSMINAAGHEIPKSALSAGEKQIYATAMLWALARASGRPLPMLIDTPLARLDATHRELLLTRYFPTASHQVILLSTDTEVDAEAYEILGPSVSHAMRLEYDAVAGATSVEQGYFPPRTRTKQSHALLEASSLV